MPTLNKDKAEKATVSAKLKKRKSNVQRAHSFNATFEHSVKKPVSRDSPGREKKNQSSNGAFPEPRYTKAVYLLLEAKKLAKEIEEKRNSGDLFRNKLRGSGRGYNFNRPGTPNFVDVTTPGNILRTAKGRALQDVSRRCEECGRSIGAGKYSQHQGSNYCNVPCYSMLFSSLNVNYKLSSSPEDTIDGLPSQQVKLRNSLIPKLRTYNTYYADTPFQISCKDTQGQFSMEGILKVYWGLKKPVTLKASDNSYWKNFRPETPKNSPRPSRSYSYGNNHNDNNNKTPIGYEEVDAKARPIKTVLPRAKSSAVKTRPAVNNKEISFQSPTVSSSMKAKDDVVCYKASPTQSDRTSFIPPYGSPTTLRVTNNLKMQDVVEMLLKKFQIINRPTQFALFTVYESGGVKKLQSDTAPLIQRLTLGPCEDVSKIFIMETAMQQDVTHEVASFCNFAMYELEIFLQKFKEEEEREVQKMIQRYAEYREDLTRRMIELQENTKVTRL
eukprot:gene12321-13592_t